MTAHDPAPAFRARYGPWALVTGASSGIGEAFARALAARGLDLLVTARRAGRLEALAAELRAAHGVRVEVLALDLADPGFSEPLAAACAGRDLGLVVSNAGFGVKGEHHTLPAAELRAMLTVNTLAPTLIAHALAPGLVARGQGGLVFTGSIESFLGFPFSSAYAATKAYVTVLGEGLWGELERHGVDVLVLAPGATDTDAPTRQGIDKAKIPGKMMAPAQVAEEALARLGRGPVHVAGWQNRWLVRLLTALPRRTALRLAGKGIRDTLTAPSAAGPPPR
jgi:short-subunit dehydrogenase